MARSTPRDLVVIGAGILGLTTTLLARRAHAEWSVLLVDRGLPGRGATQWSAAVGVAHAATPLHRGLVAENLMHLGSPPLCEYVREAPALVVVSKAGAARLQEAAVGRSLPAASDSDWDALRGGYPDILVRADEVLLDAAGMVFTVDVRAILADAVAPAGDFDCWWGSRVQSIAQTDRAWDVHFASGAHVEASRVVIATGPWPLPAVEARALASPVAHVRAKRIAALHLTPSATPDRPPAIFFPEEDTFLLAQRHEILFSFPRDLWLQSGGAIAGDFDQGDLACGLRALRRRSAQLSSAVIGGRSFWDGYAPNRLPLVQRGGTAPGLVYLVGGSGSGVGLAAGLAHRALEAL